MNASYGYRSSDGDITCSYLGAAFYLNRASKTGLALEWPVIWMVVVVVVALVEGWGL